MTPPALLDLPDDAAQALVAFLDAGDHESVAGDSVTASRDSCFQRCRDARATTLTLPWTNDNDHCRSLLQGIYRRNPHRLASFLWIQVVASWQVELLLEDSAIAECVHSVRVRARTPDEKDAATVTQMCETLCGFPRLHKLTVSSTPLMNVDVIARMTQLRELDLSRTNVTDVSALASLAELRALILEATIVTDVQCIENMTQLQVVNISLDTGRTGPRNKRKTSIVVPSLKALGRLRTLVLHKCSIESTSELIAIAPSLRQLELKEVSVRHRTLVDETAWPPRDVHEDELLARLAQLETILLDRQEILAGTSSTLAKIPSLRELKHLIDKDLQSLETLVNLEEINLWVPEGENPSFLHDEPEDYTFLLRLRQLKKIKVVQTTELPPYWIPDMQETHDEHVRRDATALANVLPQLPNLTSLDYKGYIPNDAFLPALKRLKHLALRECAPGIPSFDWISGFDTLRSLELTLPTAHSDLSAIGQLSTLEAFRLFDTSFVWDNASHGHHRFLTQLVNLKALQLSGYVEDLELLRGMRKLETLVLRTSCVPPGAAALSSLVSLRVIDVANTNLRDFAPLVSLPNLREAAIPAETDCRPLVTAGDRPPRLVRVLHPKHDCLARCHHRKVLARREWESQTAVHDSDED